MFTISRDQFDALTAPRSESFLLRVLAHVRTDLPELVAPYTEEQLGAAVQKALDIAQAHGIRTEANLCLFTDVMLWASARRDAALNRRLQAVLADPALADEDDRVQVLMGCALRAEQGAVHA